MHSLGYVILPPDMMPTLKSITDEIERLIAGSEADPQKEYPKIEVACHCMGKAQQEAWGLFDATEEGLRLGEQLSAARDSGNEALERDILARRAEAACEIARALSSYGKPDPSCDTCHGSGIWVTNLDSSGNWDWYEIGGRWSGIFKDLRQSSELSDALDVNVARVEDAVTRAIPVVIVTPEGYWHQSFGPIVMPGSIILAEDQKELDTWDLRAAEILRGYMKHLVVAVDFHS